MTEQPAPLIGWSHVSYDIIKEGVHLHIQEAIKYRGLRFVWSLDSHTGERLSRYFIRHIEYQSLNDAIKAWKENRRKKRVRLS